MEKNLKKSVAILLMGLFEDKFLESNDFDERAVEMLNGFPEDQGRYFLEQIRATVSFHQCVFITVLTGVWVVSAWISFFQQ